MLEKHENDIANNSENTHPRKNAIDEKRLRIAFYIRIRIQKYQNLILCYTEIIP